MDFNRKPKRSLELCSSDQRSPKAKEMRRDSPGDVEEFLALLDRIEATQKALCLNGRPFKWTTQELNSDKTLHIRSAASWKPSFEWEDFSSGNSPKPVGKDTKCNMPARKAISVITNNSPKENEGTRPAKCLKIFCSRSLQDTKLPAGTGLDLNVESSAEHLKS